MADATDLGPYSRSVLINLPSAKPNDILSIYAYHNQPIVNKYCRLINPVSNFNLILLVLHEKTSKWKLD